MKKSDYSNIYNNIIVEINNLLKSLTDNINEIYDNTQKENLNNVIVVLKKQKKDFVLALKELEQNSDWNIFTIAFYGETNAGKSTIIETLRILFKEQTKQQEQLNFEEIKQEIIDIENKCIELNNNLNKLENFEQNNEKKEIKFNFDNEKIQILRNQKKELQDKLSNHKIWNIPITSIPNFLKNKRKLKNIILTEKQIKKFYNEKANIYECEQYKEQLLLNLKKYSDGYIIGDGRSDFTKIVKKYEFKIENKNIAILDLPGIDGEEQSFITEIIKGLQKAHMVFYVTSKAAAPQKGDDKTEGTIDKIANHLGAQTEVYSIYNKRINNPNALNESLISKDEESSLDYMSLKLKESIGEKFKYNISLSAFPAFLGLANNFYDTINKQKKEKFLSKFNIGKLLQITLFNNFVDFLKQIATEEKENKIIEANKNKIRCLLKQLIDEIKIQYFEMKKLYEKVSENALQSKKRIQNNFDDDLTKKLKREKNKIKNLEQEIRQELYDFINNNNVDNKTLKEKLEETIKEKKHKYEQMISDDINGSINEYEEQVKKDLADLERYYDDYIEIFNLNLQKKTNTNITIKSSDNLKDMFMALGTIMLSIFTLPESAATIIIVLVLAKPVWKLIKVIYGFFDKEYKKKQQRKEINTILDDLTKKSTVQLNQQITDKITEIAQNNNDIYLKIDCFVDLLKSQVDLILEFKEKLLKLKRSFL